MSILGNNIKTLLKAYKLKQYQLANKIDVYPGRISEYIHDKYTPDYDTVKKIADFFGVRADNLLYDEFILDDNELPVINKQQLISAYIEMLPLAWSEEAEENDPAFVRAYKGISQLYKYVRDDIVDRSLIAEIVDVIYTSLNESINTHDYIETWICYLSITYFEFLGLNGKTSKTPLVKLMQNSKKIEPNQYLLLFNEVSYSSEVESAKREFINEKLSLIDKILSIIRYSEYYELAYYYLAIKYFIGMVEKDSEEQISFNIGYEMLDAYRKIGNKYATAFLNKLDKAT